MYPGEVNVAQEDLNSFLEIADDHRVNSLTQNNSPSSNSQPKSKSESRTKSRPRRQSSGNTTPPPNISAPNPPSGVAETDDDI